MAPTMPDIDGLLARASQLGASAAATLPAAALVVEDRFAALCAAPHRCPSYGLAPGCPPHALKPSRFRVLLVEFRQLLVFKIDCPMTALMGPERLAITRRIHLIAATLETEALAGGWTMAKGLAAGSCKELFCPQQAPCVVLDQGLACPHSDRARPSLSALGVHFALLAETVGWPYEKIEAPTTTARDEAVMALMAGLVLLA